MAGKSQILPGEFSSDGGETTSPLAVLVRGDKETEVFVKMFKKGVLELINDKDLQGNDLRVFLAMCAYVKYENIFDLGGVTLAELMDLSQSSVYRSMKRLEEKGYIIKYSKIGSLQTYAISPKCAYKGKPKNRRHLKKLESVHKEYGTPILA